MSKASLLCLVILTLFFAHSRRASAANKQWTGGSSTGFWSFAANWSPSGAPISGDDLFFPRGALPAADLFTTNDIANLRVRSITFEGTSGGFFLRGNPLTLSNGISATHSAGINTVALSVTNGAAQTFSLTLAAATLNLTGDLNLNGFNLTFNSAGSCNASGVIRGAGNITKNGGGTLTYSGPTANTYAGSTIINAGILALAKTAGTAAIDSGSLQIGDGASASEVRLLAANQIAATVPVTFYTNGTLNLNNFSDDVGPLSFNGGAVTTGTGTITPGDLSVNTFRGVTIDGRLSLAGTRTWNLDPGRLTVNAVITGSGNLVKSGSGGLFLNGANTFSGAVTINDGGLVISNNAAALGTTAGGTTVAGNGSLSLDSVVIAGESLTLSQSGVLSSRLTNTWTGNITFDNATNASISVYSNQSLIFPYDGRLTHNGTITGTGHLRKTGFGTLVLSGIGNNNYVGDTFVEGTLLLNKANGVAIPANGTLYIGDSSPFSDPEESIVRPLQPNQIATAPMVVERSGFLDLNGFDAVVGLLTISGKIDTRTATLFLSSNVIASSFEGRLWGNRMSLGSAMRTFTMHGALEVRTTVVGTGGIVKDGGGRLLLISSNSYSGLTLVTNGTLQAADDYSLGGTNSGTIVTNNARLQLWGNTHVGHESLTLSGRLEADIGSNSWAGNITLASDSSILVERNFFLNLSGSISGPYDLEIERFSHGTVIFSGATPNSYGDTVIEDGVLRLEKTISNGALPGELEIRQGAVVQLAGTGQIANTSRINIYGPPIPDAGGLLDLNGVVDTVGSVEGGGLIDLGSGTLQTGNDNTSSIFSGVISGTGNVSKLGAGTWTLSATNTYTGSTTIGNGVLVVDGVQPQSPVSVNSTGILMGSGTVGNITAAGTVAPGTLTCSNLVFTSAGDLVIRVDGDAFSTTHDQLIVRGTNNLGNASLNVLVGPGFTPALNQNLELILNDGTEGITGTFAGLPANSVLSAGDYQFRVSYAGGAGGNDVRLTVVSNALRLVTVLGLGGGNRNARFDPNECDTINLWIVTNTSAATMTGISATLLPRTPGLSITQPFSDYPDIPVGTRRTNQTPFQVSLLPGFQCGTNVRFDLILRTATQGNYRLPFNAGLDDTGEIGPLVRFDKNASATIPDLGTVNSTISVTGITTGIRQVAVSLHLTHSALEDLDISLISPGGVIVDLSSDNGGTASDYGTACADSERTRFEDGAASLISTSSPPFVGTFLPEGSLSDFQGEAGSNVNGDWTLRIVDDTGGSVGTLRCWSLFIASAFCPEGSGPCESCPERTIYGILNQGGSIMPHRLNTNAQPSVCGIGKFPPWSPVPPDAVHFDAYTFVNGESNACVKVTLQADCDLFSTAYRHPFDPANVAINYLADIARGTASGGSNYSFQVSAGARFVIVINEIVPNSGCRYSLTVTGGSCRPVLDIDAVENNRVAFDWSTAAIGYSLERANSIGSAPAWLPVTTTPIITDSHFRVTNNITGSRNFYRLRKP